ncbi:MAG: hypothetical protein KJ571_08880 [Bacteroidetes bacterium]|nr:hypothetical protein [Bacteroidota bacterium]
MKYMKSIYNAAVLLLIVSSFSFAQEKEMMKEKNMKQEEMNIKINQNMDGVAIKGYDPVAYFAEGKPVMGEKMYSCKWNGALWQFSSKKHLNMFKETPDKYAPQYGGFCAYGVSKNALFETDPLVWKIVDGKLYLNKNEEVAKLFKGNLKESIMNAEMNWPKLNTIEKSN